MEKLQGKGRPSNHLAGQVGQWYEDTNTGDIYECRIANEYSTLHGAPVGGYVWERRARGEDIRELYGSGSSSGVTSWNDLTDKPFYESIEVSNTMLDDYELAAGNTILNPINPNHVTTVEKDFKVVINGEEYYTTLRNLGGTPPIFVFGNPSMYDENNIDTGLPFVIVVDRRNGNVRINTLDDNIVRTVSIYELNRQIKSLDEKFVPDTIARTEDIPKASSIPDAAGETVTASEFNALLTALRNAGLMET